MITKEQAIEELLAIEEFSRNLREYLSVAENTIEELVVAPKVAPVVVKEPEKVIEAPVEVVVAQVEEPVVTDEPADLSGIIEEYGLNDMTLAELKEALDDNSIEYNKRAKKLDYFVDLVANALLSGAIPTEEDEEAPEEESLEAPAEEIAPAEVDSEEETPRSIGEKAYEEAIRTEYKNKGITEPKMKKVLKAYYEGDPDCADCKGCSKEELLQCYIDVMIGLVDDEGEVHTHEEGYMRNDEVHCCGRPCQKIDGGNYYCEICSSEYQE